MKVYREALRPWKVRGTAGAMKRHTSLAGQENGVGSAELGCAGLSWTLASADIIAA